jgi:CBS domain containing-hemolysin-like protein
MSIERPMTPILALAALIAFSGASFFFALAETSLFSLGKWQTRQLVERSPGAGRIISRLLSTPQDLLATLVLGNSFANAGIVAVLLWMVWRRDWPAGWVMSGALCAVLFGGEVAPKTLAARAPELWSRRVARPMWFLQNASRPLRRIAQYLTNALLDAAAPAAQAAPAGLSDAEYQELLETAFQQGALAAGEKEIILQIIRLDRRQARDVMKGRTQMVCIPDDLSVEEMVAAARRARHRRLPVYDETPDNIVGVLNTHALLLAPDQDLACVFEFPSFVPESMNLLRLLKSLQRQRRGLAIVRDEFGGTAGIVTIEDIMAEVVGEIHHEHEPEQAVLENLGPGRWRAGGAVRLDNFRREYPPLGETPGVETLSGLALHEFQVVPMQGESIVIGGLRLTVKAADERRIRELLVEVVKKT